jgi:hypothetical protein
MKMSHQFLSIVGMWGTKVWTSNQGGLIRLLAKYIWFLRFLFLEASKKADFFFKSGYIKSDSPLHVLPYSSVFSWYPSSWKICHLCKCSIVQRIADQLAIVNQCVESFVTQWADEDFLLDPLQRRRLKNISYFTSLASESSLFNH